MRQKLLLVMMALLPAMLYAQGVWKDRPAWQTRQVKHAEEYLYQHAAQRQQAEKMDAQMRAMKEKHERQRLAPKARKEIVGDTAYIDGINYMFDSATMEATIYNNFSFDWDTGIATGVNDPSVTDFVLPTYVSYQGRSYKVTRIDDNAFNMTYAYCEVNHLTLPDSLRSIGESAFEGLQIDSLIIPDKVDTIGSWAISHCSNLRYVSTGNGLRTLPLIGNCPSLEEISLGANISGAAIWDNIFSYEDGSPASMPLACRFNTHVKNYIVHPDNSYFSAPDGVLCSKDGTRLLAYPTGRTTVSLPTCVTSIGTSAFYDSNITELVIPSTVKKLERCAFVQENIRSVVLSESLDSIMEFAFSHNEELQSIQFGSKLKYIGTAAFENCALTEVTIPNSVKCIGQAAFGDNTQLKRFHIGSGTEFIILNPCPGCNSMEEYSVDAHNPYFSAYNGMLYDKQQFTLYAVPGGVTTLSETDFVSTLTMVDDAFQDCHNLRTVVLPESASMFGSGCFAYCDQLTSVTFLSHSLAISTVFHDVRNHKRVLTNLHDIYFRAYYPNDFLGWEYFWDCVPSDVRVHVPQGLSAAYQEVIAKSGRTLTVIDDQPQNKTAMDWDYTYGYQIGGLSDGIRTPSGGMGLDAFDFEIGLRISKEELAAYKGCTISSVSFYAIYAMDWGYDGPPYYRYPFYVFVSEGVGGKRVAKTEMNVQSGSGWYKIPLAEPYVIDGEHDLLIGYGQNMPPGFILYSGFEAPYGVSWLDYGVDDADWRMLEDTGHLPEYGSWLMSFTIEGERLPANVRMQSDMYLQADEAGNAYLVGCLESMVPDAAQGFELAYRMDGGETQTHRFDTLLTAKHLHEFRLPVGRVAKGQHRVEVWATEVDGRPDSHGGDSRVEASVVLRTNNESYERKVVVEEGTGTWCGWCPRGIVGMRTMLENHPDTFVPIAVHASDEMTTNDYLITFASYPQCQMDRKYKFDPSATTLEFYYQGVTAERANATIGMQAQWAAADSSQVLINTTTRFGYDMVDDYRIAYAVTENQVGPYWQANYYAGGDAGEMSGFENEASYVEIYHDHVARYISDLNGTEGTVPEHPSGQTDYAHTYVLTLPENIQNRANIELEVLLINQTTGEIENADRITAADVQAYDPSGFVSMTQGADSQAAWYDLHGNRIGKPTQKGVYIKDRRKVVVK